MLLVLTNSADATADYLLSRLTEASIPFVRFDTDSALDRVAFTYTPGKPLLCIDGHWYKPTDFSTVWYRRPERLASDQIPDTPEGRCVLDEWSESLEAFLAQIPRMRWMNFPAANALASRKLEQLTSAQQLGFTIPDTIVTQDSANLAELLQQAQRRSDHKAARTRAIERPIDRQDSLIFLRIRCVIPIWTT